MVSLVSDTDSNCQCFDLLISLVRENIFMIWKVVIWVILDVKHLHRFGLLPTWIFLLQIKLRINIMIIMAMIYEGTLVSFRFANAWWVNDVQTLW